MIKMFSKFRILIALLFAGLWCHAAYAQVDLTGDWAPRLHQDNQDRTSGPELGDYSGLPINDAARMIADSWDASRLSLQEHQCMSHMIAYMSQAPFPFRVSLVTDTNTQEVIAIKFYYQVYEQTQMVWMDGRPHPSQYAP